MKLRRSAGLIAVLVSACAPTLAPAPAAAQEPVIGPIATERQTVTVMASARVEREPDQAVVLLAVETFAETAEAAAAENAERTDAVLAALRRLGIPEDRVRTTSYQLNPEYDYSQGEPRRPGGQRLIGYRAMNMVQVTVDEIERVGEVIDTAIAAGANRVNGLSFQLRDPEAARREALRLAVDKARAEAQVIADALGRRLGPVVAVTTIGGFIPPPGPVFARAEMAAGPTPIQPGTLEVEAGVTAVFGLEPAR